MSNSETNRIEALEIAQAHQEQLVEELNGVVSEQWTLIDRLKKELERVRDRVSQMEYEVRKAPGDDRPPPHY